MSAGINYEVKVRTSHSKDGYLLLWKRNPQTEEQTVEEIRELTGEEVRRSCRIRKQYGKKPIFNSFILNKFGIK